MAGSGSSNKQGQAGGAATAAAAARRRGVVAAISKDRRGALVRAKRMRRGEGIVVGEGLGGLEGGMELEGREGEGEEEEEEEEERRRVEEEGRVEEAVKRLKGTFEGTARAGGAAVQQERVETLKALRQLLSANHSPPLGAAVRCGAIPLLAECLAFGAPEEQ
ncbi:unnamed protein product, partial [Closterium sp. NIES-53]